MSQPWPLDPDQPTSESDQTPSPRSALLSPDSGDFGFPDPPSAHIPRGPTVKFRHERERAHSSASARDLLHMLINEEYESKQTRKVLYTAFDRLEQETRRAEAAEARIEETIQRARAINEARMTAEQQAVRAQEELKLYKLQLDNAQKEILRAQDVLKAIEAQRDEAEAAAVSARSKARRLNEERLIEFAREEGRRLGFEEGVRRGRKIGYREAYDAEALDRDDEVRQVAAGVVDRLLETREEPEDIELERPTPIPPPSTSNRSAPEVHRIETPVNSSLENQRYSPRTRHDSDSASRSTARRGPDPPVIPPPSVVEPRIIPVDTGPVPTTASQSSRRRSGSQSWGGPPTEPPFDAPIPIQNSPPRVRHPEVFVPLDGFIPTADANHHINLPPPHELRDAPSPTPSQRTLNQPSERGGSRDYMYDYSLPRRGSPDESLASTKQSATSTISQLDLVSLPNNGRYRDRSQGLTVIHEDASMRSERTTDYSHSQPDRQSFREMRSNETLGRDGRTRQQLADELRYSDPAAAEQWRRQSDSRSQPQDGPPRQRSPYSTVPAPLIPGVQQPDGRHRRATSERQGRLETRSEHRDQRRPLSSDSSVPEISIEPPSGPPSIASSRGHRNNVSLLSPDLANHPLPVAAPPSRGPSAPSSPVAFQANLAGQFYSVPSNEQFSSGYHASSNADGARQAPVIPGVTTGGAPHRPPSERETGRSRSPISFYAASAVPAGVTYPAPPVSRSASYNAGSYAQSAGSNPSVTSEGRRRHDSFSASAGMTPGLRSRPVSSMGSVTDDGDAGTSRRSRKQSNASLGSRQSRQSQYGDRDPFAN